MNELSIIIPVYNGEKYIGLLLNDLLKLEHDSYEIIVVNDGSGDRTLEIIQQYANEYSQIKLIHQENAGPSRARNQGLSVATGRYIAFCDADDRMNATNFMTFFDEVVAANTQYAFTGYTEQNFKTSNEQIVYTSGQGAYNIEAFMDVFFENLPKNLISYMYNKIFLKTVIDVHHIRFDEDVHYAEDLLFNLDYLQHVSNVYISKTNYYLYQKYTNENSLSNNFRMDFWTSRKLVYNKLKQFCTHVDCDNDYKIRLNTYAINTLLYTINQIMDTNGTMTSKYNNIKQVIDDEHLMKFITGEANTNRKQQLMLRAIKEKKTMLVYLLGSLNSLKWKINHLLK